MIFLWEKTYSFKFVLMRKLQKILSDDETQTLQLTDLKFSIVALKKVSNES